MILDCHYLFVCLFVQWDTVDLGPPPSHPENKEKRGIKETKVEIEKSKVHQTNSRAVSLKISRSQVPITG